MCLPYMPNYRQTRSFAPTLYSSKSIMHVITKKRLLEFIKIYPQAQTALMHWYKIIKQTDYNHFSALKSSFPSADKVDKLTVFNIGGNKFRLIAAIHYNSHKVYIRQILTHEQYDLNQWKK